MIRQISKKEFAICYDGNGEVFEGGFTSQSAAQKRFGELRPFDQMVVTGRAPFCMTDNVFLEGECNGNQFEKTPGLGDKLKKACEKAGGSVKGKVYKRQLAKFFGDPRAWVSGRGDVQRVCEERNMGSEGAVTVKQREMDTPPPPPKPIADKIVHQETARLLEGQTVSGKQYKRKFAETKEKITPPWKRP